MATSQTTLSLLNRAVADLGWGDRIPALDQTNIHSLTLLPPQDLNAFIGVLCKIVKQEIYSTHFERASNPFADFFSDMLPAGYAIEDLYIDLITGAVPAWNDDGTVAMSRADPSVTGIYHKENYENQYKLSSSYASVKNAFMTVEGIEHFLNRVASVLQSSCEYDIYLQCIELLSTAYNNGAIKAEYGHSTANSSGCAALLKAIRKTVKGFEFMNNKYNELGFATRSRKEDIVIVIKSGVLEDLNVDYLAGVFNLSRADITERIIEVPDDYGFGTFDTNGTEVLAMVLDKRFMKIVPTLYEATSILNPASLATNNFLTVIFIFSYANFINAYAFCGTGATVALTKTGDAKTYATLSTASPAAGATVTITGDTTNDIGKIWYESPDGTVHVIADELKHASPANTVTFIAPRAGAEIHFDAAT